MIAVLSWVDGFGADTYVEGIFESVEEARAFFPFDRDKEYALKYQEIKLNQICSLDYYDAEYLHPKKKQNYKKGRKK